MFVTIEMGCGSQYARSEEVTTSEMREMDESR